MAAYFDRLERTYGHVELIRRARRYAWCAYILLFIVALVSGLAIHRQGGTAIMPVLVRMLPLVLFLPTLMTQRVRGYGWLAFISLLYLFQGLVITSLPTQAWLGWLETAASAVLFLSALNVVYWRRRQLKTKQKHTS